MGNKNSGRRIAAVCRMGHDQSGPGVRVRRPNGSTVCTLCKKVWARESRKRHPDRWRILKRKFGLSRVEFESMFAAQGGLCAICRRDEWGPWGTPYVDHCHKTGKVRGLLCTTCNTGLGALKDDPGVMAAAIAYVTQGGFMATYTSSGAENLRADAKVYSGAATPSPSASGKDAGGDTTGHKVLSSPGKSTPGGKETKKPAGVQTYDDEAT